MTSDPCNTPLIMDPSQWTNLPTGFTLDNKYRILRPLIKGSGGVVYLAEILPLSQIQKLSQEA